MAALHAFGRGSRYNWEKYPSWLPAMGTENSRDVIPSLFSNAKAATIEA
jgi:hypothetical protein